jgi:hypothetical protein
MFSDLLFFTLVKWLENENARAVDDQVQAKYRWAIKNEAPPTSERIYFL